MRTVAILGRGESKTDVPHPDLRPGLEYWGIGQAHRDHAFTLDRIYEVHDIDMLPHPNYDAEHWEWMKAQPEGTTAIYMHDHYPVVPCSVRFPVEGAKALCHNIRVGGEPTPTFTSSIDWAFAHAILERVDVIELYGVEMAQMVRDVPGANGSGANMAVGYSTEYVHQRPGAWGWIHHAAAMGIEVRLPADSPLMSKALYGYDSMRGYQMIRVEAVREIQDAIRNYKDEVSGQMRTLSGQYETEKGDDELGRELLHDIERKRRMLIIADGAFNALEHLTGESAIEGIVYRMKIEKRKIEYGNSKNLKMSALNRVLGRLEAYHECQNEAAWQEAHKQFTQEKIGLFIAIGAEQAMDWLIADCDKQQHDYRLHNPVSDFHMEA